MSGFMSMFSGMSDKYGKGGPANSSGFISSSGSRGGGISGSSQDEEGPSYGSAIMSGLGTLFKGREARKAQDKQNKLTKEMAAQQRKYDVEDQDFARKTSLDDRKSRQALLNPYAGYRS